MFEFEYRRPTVPSRHFAFRPLLRSVRRFLPLVDRLEASASETAAGRRRMLDAFLTVWGSVIDDHLAMTEELVIPVTRDQDTLQRALTEHRLLREMAMDGYRVRSDPDPVWVANFARRVHRYLEWEERTWFPQIERTVAVERLRSLADAIRRHEESHRRADA